MEFVEQLYSGRRIESTPDRIGGGMGGGVPGDLNFADAEEVVVVKCILSVSSHRR